MSNPLLVEPRRHAQIQSRTTSLTMMSIGAITMLVARVLANDIASVRDTRPGLDAVQVQLHGSDEISVSVVLH